MNQAIKKQMRKVEIINPTYPEMPQATIIEIENLTRRVKACFPLERKECQEDSQVKA